MNVGVGVSISREGAAAAAREAAEGAWATIAVRQGISQHYLEQLFVRLRRAER